MKIDIEDAIVKAKEDRENNSYFNRYVKSQKRNLPSPTLNVRDRVEMIDSKEGFGTIIDVFYIDRLDNEGFEDGVALRVDVLPDNQEYYNSNKSCYNEEKLRKVA